MRLITDTNILVRCSRGKAGIRAAELRRRDVSLAVTDRNVDECLGVLMRVFGMVEREATVEVARVLRPFELIEDEQYGYLRNEADARLREGGKPDWPVLAAALALEGAIWTEDVGFFGVGVPVWSSDNVLRCVSGVR